MKNDLKGTNDLNVELIGINIKKMYSHVSVMQHFKCLHILKKWNTKNVTQKFPKT